MKRVLALILTLALLLCGCSMKSLLWQEEYNAGVRYLDVGDYEEAIICFSAAIEIDPHNPDAYVLRGDTYALAAYSCAVNGDFESVLDYLQKARQDYITAEGLDARGDYDMDLRHQEVDELEQQVFAAEQETPDSEQTEDAAEQLPEVTVADAYSDSGTWSNGIEYSYQIPRFEMEGDLAAAVNEEIYGEMYPQVTDTYVVASGMCNVINYAWGQNQNLCSTVIRFGDSHMGGMGYEAYTISKATGQQVSREEILESCGFTQETFESTARQRLEQAYSAWYGYALSATGEGPDGTTGAEAYNSGLQYSLENISDAKPFLDSQGRLCAIVWISPVWDYSCMDIICLEGDSWEVSGNWTA